MQPHKKKRQKRKLTPIGWALVFILFLIIFFIIYGFCSCIAGSEVEEKTISSDSSQTTASTITDPKPIPEEIELFNDTESEALDISSENGILVSIDSNEIIAQKNGSKKIYPASMTKVMTLLVAVENAESLDDTFTYTAELIDPLFLEGATMAGFKHDETVTVRDMIYGTVLPSGADAATGLAIKIAGSVDAFVALMNEKAEELGLKNTHFMNTSGLHDPNHYSTCYDMAVIMKAAMENEISREVLTAIDYTTSITPQNPEGIRLASTMFQKIYGSEAENVEILAGKTGYTSEAGCCLVSFAQNISGKSYVLVSSKAQNQWGGIYDAIYTYAKYAGTKKVFLPPENSGPTHYVYEGVTTENADYTYFNS